jgi:DNA-binding MarR family transcriptional regulator
MVDGMDPKQFIRDDVPPVPEVAFDLQILQSLRRLMRAADIFSRRLVKAHRITGPQLMCLHKLLDETEGLTVSELSKRMFLSASTVVGILDRLEVQGLVTRVRSAADRRKVLIHVTQSGRDLVVDAPSPLQQALQTGLEALPTSQQRAIAENLKQLVQMLELQDLDAAPMLETAESLDAHWGDPGGGSMETPRHHDRSH